MSFEIEQVLAICLGTLIGPICYGIFKCITIEVEHEDVAVLTRFGKLVQVIRKPGLHFWIEKIAPWTTIERVSLKRDFMTCEDVHVNDIRGTTVLVDLWLEYRVVDPARALFQIENWQNALQGIVTSAATSTLGTFEFSRILSDRTELGRLICEQIQAETKRWGIEVELLFISRLSLLPTVSQQLFDTIAAGIEMTKADIEENGRLNAQLLEAETSSRVASLVAEAKGQYGLAVSRGYLRLKKNSEVFQAYKELYELRQLRPHRTISFHGFEADRLKSIDALMAAPQSSSVDGDLQHEANFDL